MMTRIFPISKIPPTDKYNLIEGCSEESKIKLQSDVERIFRSMVGEVSQEGRGRSSLCLCCFYSISSGAAADPIGEACR